MFARFSRLAANARVSFFSSNSRSFSAKSNAQVSHPWGFYADVVLIACAGVLLIRKIQNESEEKIVLKSLKRNNEKGVELHKKVVNEASNLTDNMELTATGQFYQWMAKYSQVKTASKETGFRR